MPWPLTFLHGLKWIVGLDDLDGVGDLLALQDIIVEAQVGNGQLEDPVVLGRVLLKDGTWSIGGVKTRPKEKLCFPTLPPPPIWSWCCQDLWLPGGGSSRLAFQDSLRLSSVNQ